MVAALRDACAGVGIEPRTTGLSFWTDAAILGASGTPSVIFGPGGAGLHGAVEYVRVAEVEACRNALVRMVRRFCGE